MNQLRRPSRKNVFQFRCELDSFWKVLFDLADELRAQVLGILDCQRRISRAAVRADQVIDSCPEVAKEMKVQPELIKLNWPRNSSFWQGFSCVEGLGQKGKCCLKRGAVCTYRGPKGSSQNLCANGVVICLVSNFLAALPRWHCNRDSNADQATDSLDPGRPVQARGNLVLGGVSTHQCPDKKAASCEGHYSHYHPVPVSTSLIHRNPSRSVEILAPEVCQ